MTENQLCFILRLVLFLSSSPLFVLAVRPGPLGHARILGIRGTPLSQASLAAEYPDAMMPVPGAMASPLSMALLEHKCRPMKSMGAHHEALYQPAQSDPLSC